MTKNKNKGSVLLQGEITFRRQLFFLIKKVTTRYNFISLQRKNNHIQVASFTEGHFGGGLLPLHYDFNIMRFSQFLR